jgi:hypothetical protein
MIVIRFLLRFILVPIGGVSAAIVATLVVCLAHWAQFLKLIAADPQAPENLVLAVIIIGPALLAIMSVGAFAMLTPAMVGVAISEIFAIRSLLFHVANGALASWFGWIVMQDFLKDFEFYKEPTFVIAAGIAAGFTYWVVAGWTAGFWKPVFTNPSASPPTAAPV